MATLELQASSNAKLGGWITFPFVIVGYAGFTLTASGCFANLIVYLIKQFNIKSIDAAQIFNIVSGCLNLAPVAGAIIADSFFGAFSVISVSASVSLLGAILFLLTSMVESLRPAHCVNGSDNQQQPCEAPSSIQLAVLYAAIALAAVGIGGTRATMGSLGADQHDKDEDRNTFFNWYFFTSYMANTIGYTAIVFIEDDIGWSWGLGLAVVTNSIGLLAFLLGKKYYRRVVPQGSPFSALARVVVAAIRKRSVTVAAENEEYYHEPASSATAAASTKLFSPSPGFRFFNSAALKTQGDTREDGSIAKSWRLCTVQEVEDLKTLLKVFPIWASCIFISIAIGILSSLVVLQALTMDRHIGPHFEVPAGSFFVFVLLSTAIFLSIFGRFILPLIQKLTKTTPSPLQHVGAGHVLNIIGMALSAIVESRRLHIARSHSSGSSVPMSALWLVVPLAIVGIGEAFHYPGQVMFYYQEFPVSLRSTSAAMTSVLVGLGFYLSTAMVDLIRRVTDWLPDDINKGRLDNVFWLLTVICVINFGCYVVCSMMYKYQNVEKPDQKQSDPVGEVL